MKKITIHTEATINARGKFNSNHCTPIMFIKLDGSEMHSFTSVADASDALGISASYISTCLNNTDNPVCKGYIVFRTKDAPMYIGKIMHYFNANASDASKYKSIKAAEDAARQAEERRLEEERKAKERHAAAVAKAEAKVAKYAAECAKYQEKFNASMSALDEANKELESLLDKGEVKNET